jgi:hypothetical protein
MQTRLIPRIILAISLLGIYLATLAPGVTWANQGADSGDLIAAAATNGVAHPSGYPTYLILARFFQFIPIGTLAFRTNLMSAVFAVCTALIIYEIVSASHKWLAALASAYAFGLSPLFWSQAVIAEVYTLHVLFISILLLLSTKETHRFFLGLAFGLGVGNHITMAFLLPFLFSKDKRGLTRHLAGMALGLMIYLTLPLRALAHPPVNWGNPVTLENFIWLVSGKLYQGQLFILGPAALWERFQTVSALFLDQFGIVGLLLGFIGLIVCFQPSRLNFSMIWVSFAFLIFPFAYDTRDSFLYLLPAFLCFAIWIGTGLDNLMDSAAQRVPQWSPVLALIFLAILFTRAGGQWPQVDASHDLRAENFGQEVMSTLPKDALVFAEGDQAVLTLWYFHHALHKRPDLTVVATDLLQNEWYQETLRHNYPRLNLPNEFFMFTQEIIARNPDRIVCRIGRDLVMQCENR